MSGRRRSAKGGNPKGGSPAPPEMRARVAELRALGRGVAAIARETGLGETTVRRWLKAPELAAEVRQISEDTRKAALDKLKAGAEGAVDRLLQIVREGEDGDAIAAAKTLLSRVGIVEGAALQLQGEALDPLAMAARLLQTAGEAPIGGG